MAYKNINLVMGAQKELVEVVAKFDPKIVRMADDGNREVMTSIEPKMGNKFLTTG